METIEFDTPAPSVPRRTTSARRVLRAVAVTACAPYLALKIAWLSGSTVGIPAGSSLRGSLENGYFYAANVLTVAMDLAVVVLALSLTRPWGSRLPAWLLVLPTWIATGLIAPILVGFPLQTVASVITGGHTAPKQKPWLDEWVFGVVYTGFGIQGLALGTLFVLYVKDRWGPLLRGRTADLVGSPTRPAQRIAAVAAAVLAVLPVVMHTVWACGGTAGLAASRVAERGTSTSIVEADTALFAALGAVGVLLAAFGAGRTRLVVPLALGWTGGAASAAWGGWMLLAPLAVPKDADGPSTSQLMDLTYAVQMLLGMLILVVGAYLLAERAAQRAAEPAAERAVEPGTESAAELKRTIAPGTARAAQRG
ncbi:hypothetical protein QMK19_29575 [Streptomyces sp. H10-C2]|uniref:hypothetical protein n=1 Tax=unclassified Streptomyces TaxID=2593676 RepID=UPI0024B9AAC2|nr:MULTISPECIES: hypothetical protein [unclassified Streptomyces]MDJ0344326.1 hypothetical protein [Streptomyces sp. PH10-H1]MDJ0373695.1 hypothetical protein [Streptomyces sp. H10-C2]